MTNVRKRKYKKSANRLDRASPSNKLEIQRQKNKTKGKQNEIN